MLFNIKSSLHNIYYYRFTTMSSPFFIGSGAAVSRILSYDASPTPISSLPSSDPSTSTSPSLTTPTKHPLYLVGPPLLCLHPKSPLNRIRQSEISLNNGIRLSELSLNNGKGKSPKVAATLEEKILEIWNKSKSTTQECQQLTFDNYDFNEAGWQLLVNLIKYKPKKTTLSLHFKHCDFSKVSLDRSDLDFYRAKEQKIAVFCGGDNEMTFTCMPAPAKMNNDPFGISSRNTLQQKRKASNPIDPTLTPPFKQQCVENEQDH